VRYEDLVSDGGQTAWRALFEHLGLDFDAGLLERFPQTELRGRYGDQSPLREISGRSLEAWRTKADTRLANAWCRRYLRWIGPERMAAMGYDLGEELRAVASVPAGGLGGKDAANLAASFVAHRRRRRALRLPEGPRPIDPQY
jgi:hypothetical protein